MLYDHQTVIYWVWELLDCVMWKISVMMKMN